MSSGEFLEIVGAICSMSALERETLCHLIGADADREWHAVDFLKHLAYNCNDLNVAAVAMKGLKVEE